MAAEKSDFIPDEVRQMIPIEEGDQSYGLAIVDLYGGLDNVSKDFFRDLFLKGVSGIVCGDAAPKPLDTLHKIIGSGQFTRPADQKAGEINFSDGFHLSAKFDYYGNKRDYTKLRLQGDFLALLWPDGDVEHQGTMAVSLAGNLALAGVLPRVFRRKTHIVPIEIKVASMAPDEEHEQPWLAVEFDLYVHKKLFTFLSLPYDLKTGYVSLKDLKELASKEE